jgi:hypothetical protein
MIPAGFGGNILVMRVAKAMLVFGLGLASGVAGACSKSSSADKDAGGQGGAPGTGGEWAAGGILGAGGRASGGITGSGGRVGSGGAGQGGWDGGMLAEAGGAQSCDGGACNAVPSGLLDPARTTTWSPGILVDNQLHLPLGVDGLPVRTTVCASPKPGDDLNAAIKACPEGQVISLAAGTYTIAKVVTLNKGVVLRGAGSQGAAKGGTTLVKSGGETALAIGSAYDQACYGSDYGTAYALTADAVKETALVTLGTNAGKFAAGDLVLIDQVDDSTVQEGDCTFFKRVDKRSVSERSEVASVDSANGTVTLSSPLHWTFKSASPYLAQMAKTSDPVVRWAGIESLAIQGGTNPGYNGQMAGGIDVSNAAYCWIKDVQTDGTVGGMHVSLTGTFRTVVRDSNFHHSADYGFGHDCYGIVLRCGAADNLIENNIVRYMNKPILFNVSGGGNVIGYNYADNSWADPPAWQEVNIDTHCSFPHMELMEGNYAPHMGATITHGNAGYLTFFRNYSSSQFAPPAVANSTVKQTGNITAIQLDTGDVDMTVIGNVLGSSAATDLGTAPLSKNYIADGSESGAIFDFGANGKSDVSYTSLWLHGNYDTVNKSVVWSSSITTHTLPASLYLAAQPAWWPAGTAWPWSGPDLSPMVGTLPAKARSDQLGP